MRRKGRSRAQARAAQQKAQVAQRSATVRAQERAAGLPERQYPQQEQRRAEQKVKAEARAQAREDLRKQKESKRDDELLARDTVKAAEVTEKVEAGEILSKEEQDFIRDSKNIESEEKNRIYTMDFQNRNVATVNVDYIKIV